VVITKFIRLHQICFSVSAVGNPAGSDSVDYLVVAGGGAGGTDRGGGGGAGGMRFSLPCGITGYPASPLCRS
jgi:hypothetical protein